MASAPESSRISSILSPISSIACSQDSRCHWPSPLAQWVPRLIGLDQLGSWPVHTPFCTSAVTVQPTEQWVQMFFLISIGTPGIGALTASAFCTAPGIMVPKAARPPTARPDCFRKARRSSPAGRVDETEEQNWPG